MLEINVKKMDFDGKNTIISRVVNLDVSLDLIVLISVKDESFGELFLNKILDSIIDRIHLQSTYKDFSLALENINAFLSTWKNENDSLKGVHAILGILEGKNFLFSNLGSSSCYLINSHNDVIEATEKEEKSKNFGFISNGQVDNGETILLGTTRVLDYLSKWDITDGARLEDIEGFNENIKMIFKSEKPKKNIAIISFRNNEISSQQRDSRLSDIMYRGMKFLDNNVIKTVLAYSMSLKKKVLAQSKQSKNILFFLWMIVCSIILYTILSGFVSISSGNRDAEEAKVNLLQAREYVRLASENINNPDIFSLNIKNGEDIITAIQQQELFLNDVSKVRDDISLLKKQFNGIETFTSTEDNTLYISESIKNPVKIVSVADKLFIVTQDSIIGPIISGQEPEMHEFENFSWNDVFIDASVQNTDIILLTSLWKVVNYAKNGFYSYLDVENQPTWEESNILSSYGQNIYLLGKKRDQLYRHKKVAGKFQEGVWYLKDEDAANIGVILSVAIDGGIYILKRDLSLVKLFVSPKYRLESIILNNLPKNYDREDDNENISIYTANNLNYFYILLGNRVLVFEPNTWRYQDVKSMQYLWQVEARDFDIEDFFVADDGEIFLLGQQWLYKLKFEVSDGKLIVR